jgi:putative transposase
MVQLQGRSITSRIVVCGQESSGRSVPTADYAARLSPALEEALAKYGKPDIINTDQSSQFTSQTFTGLLKEKDIQISTDGKGAWRDNVFVERLWRSVKYENIYLHAYENPSAVKAGLKGYFAFYNNRRPRSGINDQTPNKAYFNLQPLPMAA